MESESQVSSSVFTIDETLPHNIPQSPTSCSDSQNIRRILLLHLNLIHDQQEKLLNQERELSTLQQEKSLLQCKLQRIQRRLSKFTSDSQKDNLSTFHPVPASTTLKSVTSLPVTNHSLELKRISRKKLNSSGTAADLELRTLIPYLSYSITNCSIGGKASNSIPHSSLPEPQLELPSFIAYNIPQFDGSENFSNENLSDATFLKRHKKLEEIEKRRKRWDLQRFRQLHKIVDLQKKETNLKHLDRKNRRLYLNSESPTLFNYNTFQLEKIEVADTVPIFAFGRPLPAILPKPFEFNIL
ncbi:hypothetical protein LOD99_1750 [Oopsacas minuta]|uniref:PEHE domain-containing protein n=1 Tax=Oopsacas minuta TaxID=111878 RepID=A0AAV7K4C1_9METZ|nr:hypothetical protein LOD99_1750 [Oopsacas minuta]